MSSAIVFWSVAVLLLLMAYLFILPPLFANKARSQAAANGVAQEDPDQRNVKIARERLAELKALKAAGGISQTDYDEQVAELELALADDLDIAKQPVAPGANGRWLAFILVPAIPCLALALYFTLGDYSAINPENKAQQAAREDNPSPEQINQMVAKLEQKMKAEPNNLQGWLMLGRSYKVLQRPQDAVAALERAFALDGKNPDVALSYAEALMLANNNNWSGKPQELVNQVLAGDANNITALWFAAMSNAQQGNKPKALELLKKMAVLLPADSPDKEQISQLIANVEGQASAPASNQAAKPDAGAVAPGAPSVSLNIQVSLADALKAQASPQDTVFIYAQAASGPKMPLAISRKLVSDLPLTVSLSDADAMLPNMKLSSFQQVRLLARVSKSASAMPMPGDLIGKVEQAEVKSGQHYAIVIDDQVR